MCKINLKIVEIEKGKTIINQEHNKMWEDDIITTSNRVSYKVNGISCGTFVKSTNTEEVIQEIIPKIILDEYLNHDYSFEDLELSNPEYKTYEGDCGVIKEIIEYLNLRNCEIDLIDMDNVIDSLVEKGKTLFDIVLV